MMFTGGFMFDSVDGDRKYGSQEISDAFGSIVKDGVVDYDNDFQITVLNGSEIEVGAGSVWIMGKNWTLTNPIILTVPRDPETTQGGSYTAGRMVIRCNAELEKRYFEFAFIGWEPMIPGDIHIANYNYRRAPDSMDYMERVLRRSDIAWSRSAMPVLELKTIYDSIGYMHVHGTTALYVSGLYLETGEMYISDTDLIHYKIGMDGDFTKYRFEVPRLTGNTGAALGGYQQRVWTFSCGNCDIRFLGQTGSGSKVVLLVNIRHYESKPFQGQYQDIGLLLSAPPFDI